jgi:FG-GAP-like repeat
LAYGGVSPARLKAAKINADGKLDLVVADYGDSASQGAGIALLTGNGDGTFGFAGPFRAGKNPTDVAVGQFNADKKLDLAVADSGSKTVSILLNTTK